MMALCDVLSATVLVLLVQGQCREVAGSNRRTSPPGAELGILTGITAMRHCVPRNTPEFKLKCDSDVEW